MTKKKVDFVMPYILHVWGYGIQYLIENDSVKTDGTMELFRPSILINKKDSENIYIICIRVKRYTSVKKSNKARR
jgi:hypothetical protein